MQELGSWAQASACWLRKARCSRHASGPWRGTLVEAKGCPADAVVCPPSAVNLCSALSAACDLDSLGRRLPVITSDLRKVLKRLIAPFCDYMYSTSRKFEDRFTC